ncbi:MAG: alpha/beta fold hydrolase, partial [Planctomycetes bacterium]|nr:alpha/beta fold hydrolase [Planctomycetota bacterium]
MDANKKESPAKPKAVENQGRTIDRKHWAARIGIPFSHLKNREFRKLYPFEPHLHNLDGYSYHYLDEGEGEPVVMVHGNPTWSFFYRNLVLGLRDHYRCLVPDHLGCGLSEKPQDYPYTLENHINNLERWLEEILPPIGWNNDRVNLIVHDWGGPIGLGYAMRHPYRIRRVVVMNTSVFTAGDMPTRIKMCRWPLIGEALVRGFNLFAGEATRTTT